MKNVVTWPNWISKAKAIYSTLNGRSNLILGNKFKQVRLYKFFFFFFLNYCTEKLSETCIKLAQRKLRDCLHIFQRFLTQIPGNFVPARSPNNFIIVWEGRIPKQTNKTYKKHKPLVRNAALLTIVCSFTFLCFCCIC